MDPGSAAHHATRVARCAASGAPRETKGAALWPPLFTTLERRSTRAVGHGFGAVTPDIDADEQEQPHHVDEMPVPRGEFEAEMLGRAEMPGIGARQAHNQEDSADQHMKAVEPGRHKKGRAV